MTDKEEDKDAFEAAKQKLSEVRGRPFDVDKILATNRAKEERQRNAAKEAKAKLEKTIKDARGRRHTVHEHELESENKSLEEAKLRDSRKFRDSKNDQKEEEPR